MGNLLLFRKTSLKTGWKMELKGTTLEVEEAMRRLLVPQFKERGRAIETSPVDLLAALRPCNHPSFVQLSWGPNPVS